MNLKKNISTFQHHLQDSGATLVAVSKTKPQELILEAYNLGLRIFGENKVQELVRKHENLPKDIEWHMIGHLQTNKVKYIAPFVSLIHAVDSIKLLKEINKQALKYGRTINCLLQVHIAEEETKFGFTKEELLNVLDSEAFNALTHVKVCGLMGMATQTTDREQIRKEFRELRSLFVLLSEKHQHSNLEMTELSMGMSGDFDIAIAEGSTLVRVGSAIFGHRR